MSQGQVTSSLTSCGFPGCQTPTLTNRRLISELLFVELSDVCMHTHTHTHTHTHAHTHSRNEKTPTLSDSAVTHYQLVFRVNKTQKETCFSSLSLH